MGFVSARLLPVGPAALSVCCFAVLAAGPAQGQGAWAVARSPQNGACYVGRPPFPPPVNNIYSQILTSGLDSRAAACQSASGLKTDDPAADGKCLTYSLATIRDCSSAGVNLPQ